MRCSDFWVMSYHVISIFSLSLSLSPASQFTTPTGSSTFPLGSFLPLAGCLHTSFFNFCTYLTISMGCSTSPSYFFLCALLVAEVDITCFPRLWLFGKKHLSFSIWESSLQSCTTRAVGTILRVAHGVWSLLDFDSDIGILKKFTPLSKIISFLPQRKL